VPSLECNPSTRYESTLMVNWELPIIFYAYTQKFLNNITMAMIIVISHA